MNDKKTIENAVNNFVKDSYNCSEAIMAALCEAKGMEKDSYISFASCFGGGIGSKGHICGALTGGLIALGWLGKEKGMNRPELREKAGELYDGFAKEFDSINCSYLTGHSCSSSNEQYDISNCAPYIEWVVSEVQKIY